VYISRASMAVEVAPYVKYILLPNIKMQNSHLMSAAGTQFACFTSTKVQILTPEELPQRSCA
jgi:hypothetical protein